MGLFEERGKMDWEGIRRADIGAKGAGLRAEVGARSGEEGRWGRGWQRGISGKKWGKEGFLGGLLMGREGG
jgi:hypothetical protein